MNKKDTSLPEPALATLFKMYRNDVRRTEPKKLDDADYVAWATLGMGAETGEIQNQAKKYAYQGRRFNRQELIEELGDDLFYTVALMNRLGITLTEVMERNTAKRRARYPNGSDAHKTPTGPIE